MVDCRWMVLHCSDIMDLFSCLNKLGYSFIVHMLVFFVLNMSMIPTRTTMLANTNVPVSQLIVSTF